jgi:hypothetical protein
MAAACGRAWFFSPCLLLRAVHEQNYSDRLTTESDAFAEKLFNFFEFWSKPSYAARLPVRRTCAAMR